MSDPVIEINNVSLDYKNFKAVDNLSLQIFTGEIFSLLGLNGAGKTSTIRMLTGLVKPSGGQIKIAGHDIIQEANQAKKLIGYIPDRGYLFDKLTVRELLFLCGKLYSMPKKAIEEETEKALELFDLLDFGSELIENLSQGMRQRLVFSSALIHKPKILIIDEPMVGLDPYGAKALKQFLKNFADKGGTVFLSTHSLNVASELSSRLGIIHSGQLVTVGTEDEISEQHTSANNLEEVFLKITNRA